MLTSYYFKHPTMSITLAPVYAETEAEARELLPTQHAWCHATSDAALIRSVSGTEYQRIREF